MNRPGESAPQAGGEGSREGTGDRADNGSGDQPGPLPTTSPPTPEALGAYTGLGGLADDERTLPKRVKTFLVGRPRDLEDRSVFHRVSLIAFFAWVGLGADGLSSSCYGPGEAFHSLIVKDASGVTHDYTFLAAFLALATMGTVLVISACYSHIVEEFPSGGGGYLVASKLLGRPVGVVSGCALLVDYVLTITVSIAAAGDIMFGLLDPDWARYKLWTEGAAIAGMIVLNLRGIKESIVVLMPIFITFLVTHAILIGGSILLNVSAADDVVRDVALRVRTGINDPQLGLLGMLGMLLFAYSLGAGTYTGIEAVSNSMPVMREPRVATAKRTMLYVALSLAVTAGGLIFGYLLLDVHPGEKTMNTILTEKFIDKLDLGGTGAGAVFLWTTLLAEGMLLVVAAQAGFIDGPRILANMAQDSWLPHWFGSLSERLATHNGIMLMGVSALAALVYTQGRVSTLLVMYSINVFLTFSLSMLGMCRHWWARRGADPLWRRRLALFVTGAVLCLGILGVTVVEKFKVGGYVTLSVTGVCVAVCFGTNHYYRRVGSRLSRLNADLGSVVAPGPPNMADPDPDQPTAAILVGGYGGLGVHTLLNAFRFGHGQYKNLIFVSVGVVDSGNFKGAGAIDDLKRHTETELAKYVDLARRLGMPSTSFMAIGTDAVDELEQLCLAVARQFPKVVFFAGQLVFQRDSWFQRLFHNQTAYSLQRRLQWDGVWMVILPTRVR